MNFKKLIQDVKPHAIAIFCFFLVGCFYYIKTFQGKIHREDDVTQGLLKGTELKKYTTEDGDFPGWTNSIFSGMPSTLIKGRPSGNVINKVNYLSPFSSTAYPFQILFLSFVGFYMLMNAFKVKPLYGALAAMAYGFATYSISSVEAAHYTKVLAMAMMPALMASLHWLFRGRYLLGGVTLAFNMALQVYYFHYQITFYTIICLLVMGIYYLIQLLKEKQTKQFLLATLISVLAIGMGVAANINKIKSTSKFAENTMRGGNDMAKANSKYKQTETGKNGLERGYAFDWSYSVGETFTLLIPSFYGGSSAEKLGESSHLYEKLNDPSVLSQPWPMYHGSMRSTSGPIYVGAIIVFLFILGMVVVKDPIKWPLLILTIISFILGWGKHFGAINNFLFDHLIYFNKFRTPMMAFCIAQVTMPLIGFLGLKQLYDEWKIGGANKKADAGKQTVKPTSGNETFNKIKYTFYVVGGFCLLMALMGSSFMNFDTPNDEKLKELGYTNILPTMKEDRAALLTKDAWRSFIYIGLTFGLFWAWFTNKVQKNMAVALIAGLAVIDLIGVDWRYMNWDMFTYEKGTVVEMEKDAADNAILADKDLHYRVLDLTDDPFNDNSAAAFHKNIGGYDPAKLSRYQDIISEMIASREYSDKALDMLNCKYFIGKDSSGKRREIQPRYTFNGNAWFVQSLKAYPDALQEMNALKAANNKNEATFNSSFEANKGMTAGEFTRDSSAYAKLTSYHPDTMRYDVNNANNGYLVFSEIFYDDWKAEIDGKPVVVNKVDYTLRGIPVPAGKHNVKLYFDKGPANSNLIEKVLSIAILIGMLVMIAIWLKSYTGKQEA